MELVTKTGRILKGFEKVSNIKTGSVSKCYNFLLKEAIKEAEIKCDKLHGIFYYDIFKKYHNKKIIGAELTMLNIYLFGKDEYFSFVDKNCIYSKLVETL